MKSPAENQIHAFGDTARGLANNPLGIIALFIVLVYGFASLSIIFASNLSQLERLPLIYFLVAFPILVLGVFMWMVHYHSNVFYGPKDYKNEENFMEMQKRQVTTAIMLDRASTKAAINKQTDDQEHLTHLDSNSDIASSVNLIVSSLSAHPSTNQEWRNQILWVDDRPDNNRYERQAFEAQGLEFTLARSTSEALSLMKDNKFAAIISDMGRVEGPREGYALLETIRKAGFTTPFFIYAGSNSIEHKAEAKRRGAQGSTNNPSELFSMVMNTITSKE